MAEHQHIFFAFQVHQHHTIMDLPHLIRLTEKKKASNLELSCTYTWTSTAT